MKTERVEFSKATREAAWARAAGKCEICTAPFDGRRCEYDHSIPAGLGGDNSLRNCRCLCPKCHREKTDHEDMPRIEKAKRILETAANIRAPVKRKISSRPFARAYVNPRSRGKLE